MAGRARPRARSCVHDTVGHVESRDDAHASWISAKEWRSLRRESHSDRVFQPGLGSGWRLPERSVYRGRSAIPDRSLRPKHAIQARAERFKMEARALFSKVDYN